MSNDDTRLDTHDILTTLHTRLALWAEAKAAGDTALADAHYDSAETFLSNILAVAHQEGFEEGREERDDGDPAEDYEPDISDVGFDAFEGRYTDDC
jgi:hypothetical protein